MTCLSFKKSDVRKVAEHAESEGVIFLIRDHGVYLLSRPDKVGEKPRVAYVRGANPRVDENWSEKATELVGDSDLELEIPLADVRAALAKPRVKFHFGITTRQVSIG